MKEKGMWPLETLFLSAPTAMRKNISESPSTAEKMKSQGIFSLCWLDVPSKKHQAASSQPAPLTKEAEVVIAFATKSWVKYNYATSVKQCRSKHLLN